MILLLLIKSEEFTVTLTSINARKFKSTIFSFKKFVDYKKILIFAAK